MNIHIQLDAWGALGAQGLTIGVILALLASGQRYNTAFAKQAFQAHGRDHLSAPRNSGGCLRGRRRVFPHPGIEPNTPRDPLCATP